MKSSNLLANFLKSSQLLGLRKTRVFNNLLCIYPWFRHNLILYHSVFNCHHSQRHLSLLFQISGGASDDFAKAKALIPYAVTLELPPDK